LILVEYFLLFAVVANISILECSVPKLEFFNAHNVVEPGKNGDVEIKVEEIQQEPTPIAQHTKEKEVGKSRRRYW